MKDMNHEDVQEMLAAFSLGAVSEPEEFEVLEHVAGCEECRVELEDFEETVAWLDSGHPPVPVDLADRVLREIASDRQEPISIRPAMLRPTMRWVGIAAAVALLLLGLWGVQRFRNAERRAEVAEAALSDLLSDENRLDFGNSSKTDARIIKTESRTLFVAANLPDVPDSKTYQLWVISDARPRSIKTFEAQGGIAVEEIPVSEEAFEGALVTLEPSGGSETPSLPPVISAP